MATIRDSVLLPITDDERVTPEQRAEFMTKLAALSDEGAVLVLPSETVTLDVTLSGVITAAPLVVSISADPAVKATTKANIK